MSKTVIVIHNNVMYVTEGDFLEEPDKKTK